MKLKFLIYMYIFSLFIHPLEASLLRPITNPERTDGFGAQFQTIIMAAVFAELHNRPFVYSPFKAMEHNYSQDVNFLASKEWLINFIGNFELNNGLAEAVNVQNAISFFESHLLKGIKTNVLAKIKQIFKQNKNKATYFTPESFNIAVHVRRPNSHDSRIAGTDVDDALYLKSIRALRLLYADKHPVFHIYSQGAMDQFQAYICEDTVFHLDESVEDTFIPLVFADVLLMAPSSLSYTAGILSEGEIYYIPFWHTALPHWRSVHSLQ